LIEKHCNLKTQLTFIIKYSAFDFLLELSIYYVIKATVKALTKSNELEEHKRRASLSASIQACKIKAVVSLRCKKGKTPPEGSQDNDVP